MHDAAEPSTLQVDVTPHPLGLRVHVRGEETLENTIAYWRIILAQPKGAPGASLLLVDELHGAPLSEAQWLELVVRTDPAQVRRLKVAHVKLRGLQDVEYCELYARAHGIDARVFVDEAAAERWLREA
jgi:hypothetical protein